VIGGLLIGIGFVGLITEPVAVGSSLLLAYHRKWEVTKTPSDDSSSKFRRELVRRMDGWRHSGFNVFCGKSIHPREKRSPESTSVWSLGVLNKKNSLAASDWIKIPRQVDLQKSNRPGRLKLFPCPGA